MELTIENIIKMVIGVLVFVLVVFGIYFFFKENVIGFFDNLVPDKEAGVIIASLIL